MRRFRQAVLGGLGIDETDKYIVDALAAEYDTAVLLLGKEIQVVVNRCPKAKTLKDVSPFLAGRLVDLTNRNAIQEQLYRWHEGTVSTDSIVTKLNSILNEFREISAELKELECPDETGVEPGANSVLPIPYVPDVANKKSFALWALGGLALLGLIIYKLNKK